MFFITSPWYNKYEGKWLTMDAIASVIYSGPPLIRPPLNPSKSGLIGGVAFDEGDKMV